MASESPSIDPPQWLKSLPLAPEFHPTLAEFQDPISYILKIEKLASNYGICKIVPPLPPPHKKTILHNLNKSLSARNPDSQPTFTTRHQQIGFCPRRPRPVQRPVWQSGENYTLQEFQLKAKQFEKSHLKKCAKKGFSSLEIETLFWKASVDKPFTVEYANDMPGSAFVPVNFNKWKEAGEGVTVGETAWNMRGVARSNGSLLRFMKDEIPGVTSPMVYIAMLFSWFAWHVEDHDLHSLNYMHMGAAKTWYGVPREAGVAFEEVVRVHGYGGEVNPLVTFATLGEKTTVMSPEVLLGAGIPCCRLVQNVGEFVVTFPGAYHSGFSHGFNCGEASNIATPEWLRFAKEAAIRRASINYPPMVSHFQLLYAVALTLCSRESMSISTEPRSSRLKEKRKGEGESIVKDLFVQNVIQNNELLHVLLNQGSSCVLIPQDMSEISVSPDIRVGSERKVKTRLPQLCSNNEAPKASGDLVFDDNMLDRNVRLQHLTGLRSMNGKSISMLARDRLASASLRDDKGGCDEPCSVKSELDSEKESASPGAGLFDQGLFSCVTCGILSFACAAVVQPRKATASFFVSADCSFFNDWNDGSGDPYTVANGKEDASETNYSLRLIEQSCQDGLYDVPVQSGDYQVQVTDQNCQVQVADQNCQVQVAYQNCEVQVANQKVDVVSHTGVQKNFSSLDLLASAYGNSSDSDEEKLEPEIPVTAGDIGDPILSGYADISLSRSKFSFDDSVVQSLEPDEQEGAALTYACSTSELGCANEISSPSSQQTSCYERNYVKGNTEHTSDCSVDTETLVPEGLNSCSDTGFLSQRFRSGSAELYENDVFMEKIQCGPVTSSTPDDSSPPVLSNCSQNASFGVTTTKYDTVDVSIKNANLSLVQVSNQDAFKKHIFCLEHAVEVEKQLRRFGGAQMLLLCHPEYTKVEAEAKLLTEELGIDYDWKDIPFKEADKEEREIIRSALEDEEALPGNGDWAVKLGINLYYSANLSRSPLYSKQMPYNAIIYKAFGCSSLSSSPMKDTFSGKPSSRQKRIVVAGKWCGKVWMSNQVHPYLAQRDSQEEDSIGFNSRTTASLKPSSKPERNSGINQQIERLLLSSNPSSKLEKKAKSRNQYERVTSNSKPGPKLEREAEITHQFEQPLLPDGKSSSGPTTTIARKDGMKRKRKTKNMATMKLNSPYLGNPSEDTKAEDSSESDSSSLGGKILRREQRKTLLVRGSSVSKTHSRAIKRSKSPSLDNPSDATEAEESSESDSASVDGSFLRTERPKMPLIQSCSVRKTQSRASKRPKSPSQDIPHEAKEAEESSDCYLRSVHGRITRREQLKKPLGQGRVRKTQGRATKRPKLSLLDNPTEASEAEDSSEGDLPSEIGRIPKREPLKKPLVRSNSTRKTQSRATKRSKSPYSENPTEATEAEDSSEADLPSVHGRIPRKEQLKKQLARGSSMRKIQSRVTKKPKSPSLDDPTEAEDSSQDDLHSVRGRIPRREELKMHSGRTSQRRATKRPKSPSVDDPTEATDAGDSSESDSPPPGGRTLKSEQRKTPVLRGSKVGNIQECNSKSKEETEGGPSTRLRRRSSRSAGILKKLTTMKKANKWKEVKKAKKEPVNRNDVKDEEAEYQCDVEGCTMGFSTKQELALHKRNICSVKGCAKKFFSHKYLVQHRRVHIDDRPLKCPWKGCKMSFKWAWARTEHIRVHTGARPYVCHEAGCGQTFRFVSDFSRHKRKTGHSVKGRG